MHIGFSMHIDRLRRIFSLAGPIITAMVSANALMLVDTAMVGALGTTALAAVGIGSFTSFMCYALVMGVSTGVQAIAARRKGEGRPSEQAVSLNAGILYVLALGIPLSTVLYFLVPWLFPLLNNDPEVVALGVSYLRIAVLSTSLIGLKFSFRGYWNAVDQSRLYMWTLLATHASNVVLNYLLIFGKLGLPALGVVGAALGTALAHLLGVSIYFYLGWKHARPNGFLRRLPSFERLREVARLSIPTGLQQFSVAASFVVLYRILGAMGTMELAAASVMVNVAMVAVMPAIGLGLTATTLVGQALGRGDCSDASRWAWEVVRIAALLAAVLGAPMVLFPESVLSIFIRDPETLLMAGTPMRVAGLTLSIEAVTVVLMHALLGAGDVRRVLAVGVTVQWVLFLPAAYLLGPRLGLGILAIWITGGVLRTVQMSIFVLFWRGGRWARIKV